MWGLIGSKYIKRGHRFLHIPTGLLGDFNIKFLIYNDDDVVKFGTRNIFEAIKICKRENMYLTIIRDL